MVLLTSKDRMEIYKIKVQRLRWIGHVYRMNTESYLTRRETEAEENLDAVENNLTKLEMKS